MLILINSSKTQNPELINNIEASQPLHSRAISQLVEKCRQLTKTEIVTLMKVSDKLAQLTYQRFQDFNVSHSPKNSGMALASFKGDIFSGIKLSDFSGEDYSFAQQHLRILSGLYGILRPLDLMQPYRLEMGMKLVPPSGRTLYDFWQTPVVSCINRDLEQLDSNVVVNCASLEYAKVLQTNELKGQLLTLAFKQEKGGTLKTIAIHAKRARGTFVNWFIKNRPADPEQLKFFNEAGYSFSADLSTEAEFVFVTQSS